MTTQSLQNYNEKLEAAKQELNKDKGILSGSPTVAERLEQPHVRQVKFNRL